MAVTGISGEIVRIDALSDSQREAWRAFQSANPALASPYFSLEFAQALAASRRDTVAIALTQNGTTSGFLPLHVSRTGVARPLGGPMGDHHGVISPDGSVDLATALAAVRIGALRFHGALASQSASGTLMHETQPSWVVDMSDGFEAFMEGRRAHDAKAMRNIRARRRKLDESGCEAVFRIDDRRRDAFETLFAMKREQYRRTRAVDVFVAPWARALVDHLFIHRGPDFGGQLSTLEIDGKLAAAHFGMRSRDTLHYWFPVYDPQFSAFGPGLLLFLEMAQAMNADDVRQIHLGPGDFNFKKRLANTSFEISAGQWTRPSLTSAVLALSAGVDRFAQTLPLGPASMWPGKAMRRLDRFAALHGI